ncbi:IQ domain-containing protein E isoform X2 [Arapaima gigas]
MSEGPSDGLTDPELEDLGEDELSVITYISSSDKRPKKKKTPRKLSPSLKSPYSKSANLHVKKSALLHSLRGTRVMQSEHHSLPGDHWLASLKTGLECDGTQPKCSTSTSMPEYLKEAFGMRKPKYSRSTSNGYIPGTPDYKEKEDMYDEIIQLKKCLQAQKSENDIMKTKLRRLEEDLRKKEKQIEQLLDPSKGSDYTRGFVDKKNDSSSVLNGLKRKIFKLEQQCKEKDGALTKLQNDLKTKNVEEMKIVMEKYYEEVQRLRMLLANAESTEKSLTAECKAYAKQQKVLNSAIAKLTKTTKHLQEENESLKEELEKITRGPPSTAKGYAEWSKQRLVRRILELEKKKRRSGSPLLAKVPGPDEGTGAPIIHRGESDPGAATQGTPNGNDMQQECASLRELVKKLTEEQQHLQDTLADRIVVAAVAARVKGGTQEPRCYLQSAVFIRAEIQQLSEEKEEALMDVQNLKTVEYNKATQLFKEETEKLAEKIKELEVKLEEERCRRVGSSHHNTQVVMHSKGFCRTSGHDGVHTGRRVEEAQLVHESQNSGTENAEELWVAQGTVAPGAQDQKQERAARTIQKHWLQYKNRVTPSYYGLQDVILIQSALRGHFARQMAKIKSHREEKLPSINKSSWPEVSDGVRIPHMGDGDQEDAVVLLQSAFRGHLARWQFQMSSSMGGPETLTSATRAQASAPRPAVRKTSTVSGNYSANIQGRGASVGSDGEEIVEEIPDGDAEESWDVMDATLYGSSSRTKRIPAQLPLRATEAAKAGDSDDSDDIIVSPSRPLRQRDSYF